MLTVLSPAKKLNEVPKALPDGHQMTDPEFAPEALELAALARELSVDQLRKLSHISEPLARLNRDRFAAFSATPSAGTIYPAVQCFAGDTYQGLETRTLSPAAFDWASDHLRILSGLYGLLRPFDAIQAYRLEMGSRLANPRGADLYAFWGNRIAQAINTVSQKTGASALINCASVEYFGAVDRTTLRLPVITPVFLEERDGQAKTVSFWAKRARGAMARYICEHQITNPTDLHSFDSAGYKYDADRSSDGQMVFVRGALAQQAA